MSDADLGWETWLDRRCSSIEEAGRWRRPRDLDARGPRGVLVGTGAEVVSFASNDYLGLTHHPAVTAAAHAAIDRWGAGSGAARLIVGSRPVHAELESALADWKGTAAATVLSTGFAANTGLLATLAGPGVLVCSDELNHASIIDGCRMARAAGARVAVFGHGDVDHLDRLLADHDGRALVVTDLVFSMDGDLAPLEALTACCERHQALLVLDEAHAVLGPEPSDPASSLLVRVGTLSKTLGSLGGFVAGPTSVCDLVVNAARPYIFSTALPPADAAAALAAVAVVRSGEGTDLRRRLRHLIDRLAPGWPSPILPVIVGDEHDALAAADALLADGLLVPAIRPPTVPAGTCRLRIAISAAHTDDQVDQLRRALTERDLRIGLP